MMISNNSLKKFSIACAAILLLILFLKHIPKYFGFQLDNNTIFNIVSGIVVLCGLIIATGAIKVIRSLAAWSVIFLLVITAYAFKSEFIYIAQRALITIKPGYIFDNDHGQIMISRSKDGHFYLNTIINGKNIQFLVDTGASNLALSREDANILNIDLNSLNYNKSYLTANGRSVAAPVLLNELKIGNKILRNVIAHVAKGDMSVSLLGMSIIEKFDSFKIDQDILTLSYSN